MRRRGKVDRLYHIMVQVLPRCGTLVALLLVSSSKAKWGHGDSCSCGGKQLLVQVKVHSQGRFVGQGAGVHWRRALSDGHERRRRHGLGSDKLLRHKLLLRSQKLLSRLYFCATFAWFFRPVFPFRYLLFIHALTNATDYYKYSLLPSADFDIAKVLVLFSPFIFP